MCSVLITSLPVTTPLPSGVCGLGPAAPREVQGAFTPKITSRVPLSSSFHAPSREGEGLPVTLGWSDTDGTPDVWPELVMGGWRQVWREPHATTMCCPVAANNARFLSVHFFLIRFFFFFYIYFRNCATHIGFSSVSPTVAPASCCTQLAAPPFPAATGAPIGPSAWQGWALPHQSSLAAAALSCALADGTGVGQSHSSCDCVCGPLEWNLKWSRAVSKDAVEDVWRISL